MTAGGSGDERLKGCALVILASALHGGVPVAGKYCQRTMSADTFAFLWVFFAAVFTFLFFTAFRRWPSVIRQAKGHWPSFVVMGICQAAASWAFFYGVRFIDPTVAAFFGRASAVFSLILGVLFLKERFNRWEAAGIVLAIGGAFIISYRGGSLVLRGMLAVIASCFFFAIFTLIGKVKVSGVHPIVLVSAATTIASVILFATGLFSGNLNFNVPAAAYAALAGATFTGGFLGISIFYWGLKYIGFAVGSALRSAQTVFVAVLAFATLRMLPDLKGWIGGGVIVAGVTLITLSSARQGRIERARRDVGEHRGDP